MQQTKELPGDITPAKFNKRKDEIQIVLDEFISDWNANETAIPLSLLENAADKIAYKYFELSQNVIKRYLPKKSFSNKFKVASGCEIASMFVLPIRIPNDPSYTMHHIREVNSRFALKLSFTMLYNIHFEETGDFPTTMEQSNELAKIIENHRLWLSRINTEDLETTPTFINSNFWEAFFFASTGTL